MSEERLDRANAQGLERLDPLGPYRDRFLLADPGLIYLNGNSLGALPLATMARLQTVLREEWGLALARSWEHWIDLPVRAGDLVGELIGAAPGQVIVTDDANFPSDRYVLAGLAAQRGVELRMLATDIDEGVRPELVRAAAGDDPGPGRPAPGAS